MTATAITTTTTAAAGGGGGGGRSSTHSTSSSTTSSTVGLPLEEMTMMMMGLPVDEELDVTSGDGLTSSMVKDIRVDIPKKSCDRIPARTITTTATSTTTILPIETLSDCGDGDAVDDSVTTPAVAADATNIGTSSSSSSSTPTITNSILRSSADDAIYTVVPSPPNLGRIPSTTAAAAAAVTVSPTIEGYHSERLHKQQEQQEQQRMHTDYSDGTNNTDIQQKNLAPEQFVARIQQLEIQITALKRMVIESYQQQTPSTSVSTPPPQPEQQSQHDGHHHDGETTTVNMDTCWEWNFPPHTESSMGGDGGINNTATTATSLASVTVMTEPDHWQNNSSTTNGLVVSEKQLRHQQQQRQQQQQQQQQSLQHRLETLFIPQNKTLDDYDDDNKNIIEPDTTSSSPQGRGTTKQSSLSSSPRTSFPNTTGDLPAPTITTGINTNNGKNIDTTNATAGTAHLMALIQRKEKMRGISIDETVARDNRSSSSNDKKWGDRGNSFLENVHTVPGTPITTIQYNDKSHDGDKENSDNLEDEWNGKSPTQSSPRTPQNPPSGTKRRRNLSFRLLYSGDEEEYEHRNGTAPSTSSLTLSERLWLGPKILQFQRQQQEKQDAAEEESERRERKKRPSSYGYLPPLPDDKVRNKWLDHLNSFQESTADVDVQMEEFIKVPAGVEQLMGYGFFICVDSFLYMVTVLPIRFVWNCFLLILYFLSLPRRTKIVTERFQFHRQHLYQIIQVMILCTIYRYVLMRISIGKLYHWIRGQAMLKLYVLIAIVEVFDRLFSSLGQDCLESMYWNTVNRPRSRRMLISIMVVLVYASLHSLLLFVHVVTMHVAMNSEDQVLLTLLISGNFAEIKSTVFKKYNKAALFKISASDVCERFKLSLFLSLVLLLNLCQGMEEGQLASYMRIWGLVSGAEMVSDWIKHAFITKFNFLPSRVYNEYALLLAGDVTGIGHEGVNLDHSHAVVKRIGFAQMPLVCIFFRLLREASKYHVPSNITMYSVLGVWLFFVVAKIALGNLLFRASLNKLWAAPEYSQQPAKSKTKMP